MRSNTVLLGAAFAVAILAPAVSYAELPVPPPAVAEVPSRNAPPVRAPSAETVPLLPLPVDVNLGARVMLVPSSGYDPFSGNDVLPACALSFGVTVARLGRVAVVVTGELDGGGSGATARGTDASLTMGRFAVGGSARYLFADWFYLFAKVEPGAYHISASIVDPAATNPLAMNAWTWGLDLAGGAAVSLFRIGDHSPVRIGLTTDFGAALAGAVTMRFVEGQVDGTPPHPAAVTLPDLRPAGFFYKLGVNVGF